MKHEIQKPSTCHATLLCCKFCVDVLYFSLCMISISPKNHYNCCRLKKSSMLIDWLICLVWIQDGPICCITSCEFDEKLAKKAKFVTQSRSPLFFTTTSSTRNKWFCRAKNWPHKVKLLKHWPKTCNHKMLCHKLRVFVSLILSPLPVTYTLTNPTTSSITQWWANVKLPTNLMIWWKVWQAPQAALYLQAENVSTIMQDLLKYCWFPVLPVQGPRWAISINLPCAILVAEHVITHDTKCHWK